MTTRIWCERTHTFVEVPVAWSGADRRYLTTDETPAPRVERRAEPRPQSHVSDAWLAGQHYRDTDGARVRMAYAARTANVPFTVKELAQAARVSPTLARRFLAVAQRRGECRRVGRRQRACTFADLFAFGAAWLIVAGLTSGERLDGAQQRPA